ncbi:hypothetical protein LINPERHAP1_LOCUS22064 [Linum perenne]
MAQYLLSRTEDIHVSAICSYNWKSMGWPVASLVSCR